MTGKTPELASVPKVEAPKTVTMPKVEAPAIRVATGLELAAVSPTPRAGLESLATINLDALASGAGAGGVVGLGNEFAGIRVDGIRSGGTDGASLDPTRAPDLPDARPDNGDADALFIDAQTFLDSQAAAKHAKQVEVRVPIVDTKIAPSSEVKKPDIHYQTADGGVINAPSTSADYATYQEIISSSDQPLTTAEFNQKVADAKTKKAEETRVAELRAETALIPGETIEDRNARMWNNAAAKRNEGDGATEATANTTHAELTQNKVEEVKTEAKIETADEKTARITQLKSELSNPKLSAEERLDKMQQIQELSKEPDRKLADLQSRFDADPNSLTPAELKDLATLQAGEKPEALPEERKAQLQQELNDIKDKIIRKEGDSAENFMLLQDKLAEIRGMKLDGQMEKARRDFVEAYIKNDGVMFDKETGREVKVRELVAQIGQWEAQVLNAPENIAKLRAQVQEIKPQVTAAEQKYLAASGTQRMELYAEWGQKDAQLERNKSMLTNQKNITLHAAKELRNLREQLHRLQGTGGGFKEVIENLIRDQIDDIHIAINEKFDQE